MMEKVRDDKKYRSKIELIGYGIFILIALMFAVSGSRRISVNATDDDSADNIQNSEVTVISLFNEYNYDIEATINENTYKFNGEYHDNILTINKEDGSKYEYKDNNYYLVDTNDVVNDNIYSPLDEKYLSINLINQYLSKAKYEDNEYRVYLKDIILGNDSNDYITINYTGNLNQINIDIDYTNLLKQFDNDIEKYLVVMKYNKSID